jgi:restriction system protein
MTDDAREPPPRPQIIDSGLSAVFAAWQHRQRQWYAAVAAQGTVTGRPSDPPLTAHAAALTSEGQRPEVLERKIVLPELLIPAAIVVAGDKVAEGQLIQAVALPWFEIIRELERDPAFLHQLDWRKVEELIAGAYQREGWPEVILTPRSGDRGRDIIARRPGLGAVCFYDQVKAYGPEQKVTAAEVREMFGVLNRDHNVSKALLTTTATFAPGVADEWKQWTPFRLELRDGATLAAWLTGLQDRP